LVARAGKSDGGRGGDPSNPTDVTGHKRLDKSSPALGRAVVKGHPVVSAKFRFFRREDDGSIANWHTIELENGMVTSVQTGGGPDARTEAVSFRFEPPSK